MMTDSDSLFGYLASDSGAYTTYFPSLKENEYTAIVNYVKDVYIHTMFNGQSICKFQQTEVGKGPKPSFGSFTTIPLDHVYDRFPSKWSYANITTTTISVSFRLLEITQKEGVAKFEVVVAIESIAFPPCVDG